MEFLETLLVEKGEIKNWKLHRARMERTLYHFYRWSPPSRFYFPVWRVGKPPTGKYRMRVVYSRRGIESVELFPLPLRQFKRFGVVEVENLEYRFKYLDRTSLNRIRELFPEMDEVIIVKNGFVTDTTISNLAFWTGERWITPSTPLLKGTMLEWLLKEKKVESVPIKRSDLPFFKKLALLNALLGFEVIEEFQLFPLTHLGEGE